MYEIRIIPDVDFDKLPYKKAQEAYGLADAKRGLAYIRETGVREVDLNTINHEFDELLQKVSPHEEDGIRYKGGFFKKAFRPLLSIASIVPSPLQPFAAAANIGLTGRDISKRGFKPLDALSLAGPVTGALKGLSSAGPGFASHLGGALKGSVGVGAPQRSSPTRVSTLGAGVPKFLPGQSGSTKILDAFKGGASSLISSSIASKLSPSSSRPLSNVGASRTPTGGSAGALDRFAPNLTQANTPSTKFITDDDVLSAFQGIDSNSSIRSRQAQQRFRGQSREGNTAFNSLLNNIAQSNQLEKDQFVDEANRTNEEKQRQNIKADIIKLNNLSEAQFNQFLAQAQAPNAPANLKSVFAAFL